MLGLARVEGVEVSGSGAVLGPGEAARIPNVLMSFGWNRPRLFVFFNYTST